MRRPLTSLRQLITPREYFAKRIHLEYFMPILRINAILLQPHHLLHPYKRQPNIGLPSLHHSEKNEPSVAARF
jgi:hypothetical protein